MSNYQQTNGQRFKKCFYNNEISKMFLVPIIR